MSIEDYTFSDEDIDYAIINDTLIRIYDSNYEINAININKDDAIAIARHFGLIEDDSNE